MKAKDIVVGECYAVGVGDNFYRGVVLEVGPIERKVHANHPGGWRQNFGSSGYKVSNAPGARVRQLNFDGTEAKSVGRSGDEFVVTLRQVLRPWSEQEEIQAIKVRLEGEAREADKIRSAQAEFLTVHLRALGFRASAYQSRGGIEVAFHGVDIDRFVRVITDAGPPA